MRLISLEHPGQRAEGHRAGLTCGGTKNWGCEACAGCCWWSGAPHGFWLYTGYWPCDMAAWRQLL